MAPLDITEGLPFYLPSSTAAAYGPTTDWDVTVGPCGFNLRPSANVPYRRGTEPQRKQQIDTSDSPGEQSLSSWWFRSQDSWEMGAGIRWYEPKSDPGTANRFADSLGVDVWTPGQISLLDELEEVSAEDDEIVYLCGLVSDGVGGYVRAWDDNIEFVPSVGSPVTDTLDGGDCTQPTAAGGAVYIGYADGVGKWDPVGPTFTELYTHLGTTSARCWWVKARLIVAVDNILYEAPINGAGTAITGEVQLYAHPDTTWVWSDVAEVGSAIFASGYSQNDSGVFRFVIENDETGVPTLFADSGSQVVHMPPGEAIKCLAVYLGAFVVLGTTEGVRIGVSDDAGNVQYGPLTVETAEPTDITFRDRFAYVSVTNGLPDGTSGAVRIDLSSEIDNTGRYAWAWDVSSGVVGPTDSIALVGNGVYLSVDGAVYGPSGVPVESGYLETGKIRFGTVEPKAFRLMRLISVLNGGTISITAITPNEAEHTVINFDPSYLTSGDVGISIPGPKTAQHLSFRLYLGRSPEDASPVVNGFVVKAVPAASRVRVYQFPVMIFDYEEDRHGNKRGEVGGAWTRLSVLEGLEASGEPIQVIDQRINESFTGQIDSVDFQVTSPPDRTYNGFGGIAVVTIRKV